MTEISVTEHVEQPTAGVRQKVRMSELTEFFGRAFEQTMDVLLAQDVQAAGPPFGKYYGTPTDVVDVEAGFPVSAPITAAGVVVPGTLPGGKIAEAIHVGPYDAMEATYAELEKYLAEAGLTRAEVMWESYLSDQATDPATWRTQICWPVS